MVARTSFVVWVILAAATFVAGCGGEETGSQNSGTGPERLWNFDEEQAGSPPQDSEVFSGTWEVRAEGGAPSEPNALCQTAEAEFPAVVLSDASYTDFALSTQFKPISGEEDQAAGLIFRVEDENNYYIVRANALEDNVDIYKYVDGERTQTASEPAELDTGEWRGLRVEVEGEDIRVLLDKKEVVEATDDEFTAGRVGLWTKADSTSCFDNVMVGKPVM